MKFRLWTILWVFALFAGVMSLLGGGWGIFVSLVVLGVWALVIRKAWTSVFNTKRLSIGCVLTVIVIVLIAIALLLPASGAAREAPRWMACMNNMKQFSLSLLNYHNSNGSFPPANSVDEEGRPIMSWRPAILPYLEEKNLFNALQHTEPWDGPKNEKLTSMDMAQYVCPSDPNNAQTGLTSYFAVVDDRTVWPGDVGRKLSDISDGKANTILLIECGGKNTPWAKPEDLTFDEAVGLLAGTSPYSKDSGHPRNNGFFYKPSKVINVAFVDGSVQGIHVPISRELASAMLTCSGGEEINESNFNQAFEPELDYAVVFSVAIFLLLALLPALRWMPVRSVAAVGEGILPEWKKSEPPPE